MLSNQERQNGLAPYILLLNQQRRVYTKSLRGTTIFSSLNDNSWFWKIETGPKKEGDINEPLWTVCILVNASWTPQRTRNLSTGNGRNTWLDKMESSTPLFLSFRDLFENHQATQATHLTSNIPGLERRHRNHAKCFCSPPRRSTTSVRLSTQANSRLRAQRQQPWNN